MQLLTSDIMEKLIEFYKKYEIEYEIVFRQDTVYIRFFTGNMFEPQVGKSSMDKETLYIYLSILELVVDISKTVNKVLQEIDI